MACLVPQRAAWTILALVAVVVLGGLGLAASLCLHYHNAPDFDTYVRDCRVAKETIAQRWPATEVLARGSDWRIGDIDPFALSADDPRWRKHAVSFTTNVKHGEEWLASVVQELAVAEDKQSGDRHGAAVRTTVARRDPRLRVHARVWIDDGNVIGPGSTGKGHAVFDVIVAAGAGASEDELDVARLPEADFAELNSSSVGGGFLSAPFHPGGAVNETGLMHELRRSVYLGWQDRDGSSSSTFYQALETWKSTNEYSSEIECTLAESGFSTTNKLSTKVAWNGRTW